MSKQLFLIEDWAGNLCFEGKEFPTFDDAWEYIYERFPNGDETGEWDEYYVIRNTGIHK